MPDPVTRYPRMVDLRLLPALAGVWVGTAVVFAAPALTLPIAACLVIGALVLVNRRGGGTAPRHALVPTGSWRNAVIAACVAGVLGSVGAGQVRAAFDADPTVRAALAGEVVTIRARIDGHPAPDARRTSVFRVGLRVTDIRGSPRVGWRPSAVTVHASGSALADVKRGDLVEVRGRLRTGNASAPSAGFLTVSRADLIERPGGWRALSRTVEAGLARAVANMPAHARALVPGMSIGADQAMGPDLKEAMRTASLTHLTAVSGTHIAIALAAVAWLMPRGGLRRVGACAAVLGAFIVVVGPEPSILRSASMAGVAMAGLLSKRPGQSMAALCAVATAMLLLDPWCAVRPGFAMSVLATFGVVGPAQWIAGRAKRRLRDDTAIGRGALRVVEVVAVPVCAQVLVCPVLLAMEPWLPTWGVVANVCAAPAVAPACLLSLAAALCGPWWPWGAWLCASAARPFTWWIAGVAGTVSCAPLAQLPWPGGGAGIGLLAAVGCAGVAGALAVGRLRGNLKRGRRFTAGFRRIIAAWRNVRGSAGSRW